jgi:exosortase/archaeosortase
VVAFLPYISSIRRGGTRPHVFSWLVWSLVTGIVFFAQLEADGGVGAWPTALAALLTLYIAVLAFRRRGDIQITATDWLFLLMALGSLPFWFLTSDPLWTVVVLTLVDTLAFGPTIRRAYIFPYQENLTFFLLFIVRNLFSIAALESYSITTVLFPAVISLTCGGMVVTVYLRRRTTPAEIQGRSLTRGVARDHQLTEKK